MPVRGGTFRDAQPRIISASHLVMRGVALKAVQELLGDATIDMPMRYAHLSPDVKRDAVRLLDVPPPPRREGTSGAGPSA